MKLMKHMAENSRFVRNYGDAGYIESIFETASSEESLIKSSLPQSLRRGKRFVEHFHSLVRHLENPNMGYLVCGYPNEERQDIKIRMSFYPIEWE